VEPWDYVNGSCRMENGDRRVFNMERFGCSVCRDTSGTLGPGPREEPEEVHSSSGHRADMQLT
jgi:hypothetical protein